LTTGVVAPAPLRREIAGEGVGDRVAALVEGTSGRLV